MSFLNAGLQTTEQYSKMGLIKVINACIRAARLKTTQN